MPELNLVACVRKHYLVDLANKQPMCLDPVGWEESVGIKMSLEQEFMGLHG